VVFLIVIYKRAKVKQCNHQEYGSTQETRT